MDTGNRSSRRNAVQGAETSGRGWRVADVENVPVDGVFSPVEERRGR